MSRFRFFTRLFAEKWNSFTRRKLERLLADHCLLASPLLTRQQPVRVGWIPLEMVELARPKPREGHHLSVRDWVAVAAVGWGWLLEAAVPFPIAVVL